MEYREAKEGKEKVKYGDNLIKEWSLKLSSIYGKGYDSSNLKRFQMFYLNFSILGPVGQLSWAHIRYITNRR